MADKELELYFYNECGFSRSVLNTITNLGVGDKIVLKNIREEPQFLEELVALCGNKTVPTLVIDGSPMREAEAINNYLVEEFIL